MFQKALAPIQTTGSSTRVWSVFEIPGEKQSLGFTSDALRAHCTSGATASQQQEDGHQQLLRHSFA